MENIERLADQLCTVAVMHSFVTVDRRLLKAFDEDDHATIAECAIVYEQLIYDLCKHIPAETV